MDNLLKCLSLYIGCNTNKGRFVGLKGDTLLIESENRAVQECNISTVGDTLFLFLKPLGDLDDTESKQLIKEGLVIGRPYGYTFSNRGFLYLLLIEVDLFGLISSGFAKNKRNNEGNK